MIDFKDHDQIIHLLTNDQIVVFLANGIRKITSKNRFALQLGNIVDIEIFKARLNNQISKLKKAHLVIQPPITTSDTAKVILLIIEEINKITLNDHGRINNLFSAIKNSWKYLGGNYNHHIKTYVIYNLLNYYGLEPQLNKCIECHRTDRINGFMFENGGFSCFFHTSVQRNLDFLKAINYLGKNFEKYLQVDNQINHQIFQELNNYLRDFANY